jgi:hypothetical protein
MPFMQTSFLKVFACRRAVDCVLALRSAAGRTDISAEPRAVAARALLFTQLAGSVHRRITLSYHRCMRRTDVYLKVELVLDEKETPERVAAEICRQVRKLHSVRQAEVSSIVDRE